MTSNTEICFKEALPCLSSYRCLPRMVKGTRNRKLKYEIKDLLFIAFQQKLNPEPLQSLHGLVMG
jgi:hypothetical protein